MKYICPPGKFDPIISGVLYRHSNRSERVSKMYHVNTITFKKENSLELRGFINLDFCIFLVLFKRSSKSSANNDFILAVRCRKRAKFGNLCQCFSQI